METVQVEISIDANESGLKIYILDFSYAGSSLSLPEYRVTEFLNMLSESVKHDIQALKDDTDRDENDFVICEIDTPTYEWLLN